MKTPKSSLEKFPFLDPNYTLVHPRLIEGVADLKLNLSVSCNDELIVVMGPTGAGKSHISDRIVKSVLAESANEMKTDLQYLPAVLVSLRMLSEQGRFNWTTFYTAVLKALKHPNPSFSDLGDARDKLKTVLRSRRVRYLFIDESDHFLMDIKADDITRTRKIANVLKSVVQDTETKLVLIGTYDLSPLVDSNGQLSRRSRVVHVSRYRNTKADREAFKAVLKDMDRDFQGFFSFSLAERADEIYRGCVGLIGVKSTWFARAVKVALKRGAASISWELLDDRNVKFSVNALNAILTDATNGEEDFEGDDETAAEFLKATAAPSNA